MEKLAILGGMGPLATKVFYEKIIAHEDAKSDNEHLDILISSHASMPDRTQVILKGLDKSLVLKEVEKDLKIFEAYGAKNLAIPCNTFHYFYEDVKKLTKINIINMPYETLKELSKRGKKFIVLGTDGTKKGKVYKKFNAEFQMEEIETDQKTQEKIMEIIYKIKETNMTKNKELNDIIRTYKKLGAISILACTELSCIEIEDDLKDTIIDPLEILTKKSIELSGQKYK